MNAGDLRHRITLQQPGGTTRDETGAKVKAWPTVATIWANVRPVTAREQFMAAQQQASTTHVVTIRAGSAPDALDARWRIVFKGRILRIDGPPRDLEERGIWLEMDCTEGLAEG
jgi:SPP1 family predicted phage head-tail adaptor